MQSSERKSTDNQVVTRTIIKDDTVETIKAFALEKGIHCFDHPTLQSPIQRAAVLYKKFLEAKDTQKADEALDLLFTLIANGADIYAAIPALPKLSLLKKLKNLSPQKQYEEFAAHFKKTSPEKEKAWLEKAAELNTSIDFQLKKADSLIKENKQDKILEAIILLKKIWHQADAKQQNIISGILTKIKQNEGNSHYLKFAASLSSEVAMATLSKLPETKEQKNDQALIATPDGIHLVQQLATESFKCAKLTLDKQTSIVQLVMCITSEKQYSIEMRVLANFYLLELLKENQLDLPRKKLTAQFNKDKKLVLGLQFLYGLQTPPQRDVAKAINAFNFILENELFDHDKAYIAVVKIKLAACHAQLYLSENQQNHFDNALKYYDEVTADPSCLDDFARLEICNNLLKLAEQTSSQNIKRIFAIIEIISLINIRFKEKLEKLLSSNHSAVLLYFVSKALLKNSTDKMSLLEAVLAYAKDANSKEPGIIAADEIALFQQQLAELHYKADNIEDAAKLNHSDAIFKRAKERDMSYKERMTQYLHAIECNKRPIESSSHFIALVIQSAIEHKETIDDGAKLTQFMLTVSQRFKDNEIMLQSLGKTFHSFFAHFKESDDLAGFEKIYMLLSPHYEHAISFDHSDYRQRYTEPKLVKHTFDDLFKHWSDPHSGEFTQFQINRHLAARDKIHNIKKLLRKLENADISQSIKLNVLVNLEAALENKLDQLRFKSGKSEEFAYLIKQLLEVYSFHEKFLTPENQEHKSSDNSKPNADFSHKRLCVLFQFALFGTNSGSSIVDVETAIRQSKIPETDTTNLLAIVEYCKSKFKYKPLDTAVEQDYFQAIYVAIFASEAPKVLLCVKVAIALVSTTNLNDAALIHHIPCQLLKAMREILLNYLKKNSQDKHAQLAQFLLTMINDQSSTVTDPYHRLAAALQRENFDKLGNFDYEEVNTQITEALKTNNKFLKAREAMQPVSMASQPPTLLTQLKNIPWKLINEPIFNSDQTPLAHAVHEYKMLCENSDYKTAGQYFDLILGLLYKGADCKHAAVKSWLSLIDRNHDTFKLVPLISSVQNNSHPAQAFFDFYNQYKKFNKAKPWAPLKTNPEKLVTWYIDNKFYLYGIHELEYQPKLKDQARQKLTVLSEMKADTLTSFMALRALNRLDKSESILVFSQLANCKDSQSSMPQAYKVAMTPNSSASPLPVTSSFHYQFIQALAEDVHDQKDQALLFLASFVSIGSTQDLELVYLARLFFKTLPESIQVKMHADIHSYCGFHLDRLTTYQDRFDILEGIKFLYGLGCTHSIEDAILYFETIELSNSHNYWVKVRLAGAYCEVGRYGDALNLHTQLFQDQFYRKNSHYYRDMVAQLVFLITHSDFSQEKEIREILKTMRSHEKELMLPQGMIDVVHAMTEPLINPTMVNSAPAIAVKTTPAPSEPKQSTLYPALDSATEQKIVPVTGVFPTITPEPVADKAPTTGAYPTLQPEPVMVVESKKIVQEPKKHLTLAEAIIRYNERKSETDKADMIEYIMLLINRNADVNHSSVVEALKKLPDNSPLRLLFNKLNNPKNKQFICAEWLEENVSIMRALRVINDLPNNAQNIQEKLKKLNQLYKKYSAANSTNPHAAFVMQIMIGKLCLNESDVVTITIAPDKTISVPKMIADTLQLTKDFDKTKALQLVFLYPKNEVLIAYCKTHAPEFKPLWSKQPSFDNNRKLLIILNELANQEFQPATNFIAYFLTINQPINRTIAHYFMVQRLTHYGDSALARECKFHCDHYSDFLQGLKAEYGIEMDKDIPEAIHHFEKFLARDLYDPVYIFQVQNILLGEYRDKADFDKALSMASAIVQSLEYSQVPASFYEAILVCLRQIQPHVMGDRLSLANELTAKILSDKIIKELQTKNISENERLAAMLLQIDNIADTHPEAASKLYEFITSHFFTDHLDSNAQPLIDNISTLFAYSSKNPQTIKYINDAIVMLASSIRGEIEMLTGGIFSNKHLFNLQNSLLHLYRTHLSTSNTALQLQSVKHLDMCKTMFDHFKTEPSDSDFKKLRSEALNALVDHNYLPAIYLLFFEGKNTKKLEEKNYIATLCTKILSLTEDKARAEKWFNVSDQQIKEMRDNAQAFIQQYPAPKNDSGETKLTPPPQSTTTLVTQRLDSQPNSSLYPTLTNEPSPMPQLLMQQEFLNHLQAVIAQGVAQGVAQAVEPLKQEIQALRHELASARQQATTPQTPTSSLQTYSLLSAPPDKYYFTSPNELPATCPDSSGPLDDFYASLHLQEDHDAKLTTITDIGAHIRKMKLRETDEPLAIFYYTKIVLLGNFLPAESKEMDYEQILAKQLIKSAETFLSKFTNDHAVITICRTSAEQIRQTNFTKESALNLRQVILNATPHIPELQKVTPRIS